MKTKFNDFMNENKLDKSEYELLYKKLEYKFKKSGNVLVNKLKDEKDLSDEDIELLLKKLEYNFRKSEPEIIEKLKKIVGREGLPNIKFSNLKAKKQKDIRESDK
jgi:hypothetical protein